MSEMSDYLEGALVDHIFRNISFAKPTVLAFALLTTAADDANTGVFTAATPGVEVANASGYSRVAHNPSTSNWTAVSAGDGQTDNGSAITYTQATGSWGTVTAMAICSATAYNTGNMLFHSTVTTSRAIDNGDTAEFATGAVTVTLA
jgi:hypothetical protein